MYDFKPISSAMGEIREISELLTNVFPDTDKFTSEFLKWQYLDNPMGTVVGFNAFEGEELAAHYATIPVNWKINSELKKGLLSLNTATHINHRGKKLFTQLAEATYKLAQEQGYEFVVGVANANSTPGFLKKLNFKLIAPLNAYIALSGKTTPEESFSTHSVWNTQDLDWRIQNPSNLYYINKEVLLSKTHIGPLAGVLGNFSSPFQSLGKLKSPLKLHIGLNHTKVARIKIPRKLQPSPLNLIYKSLSDHPIPDKKDILFRLIDFDAY